MPDIRHLLGSINVASVPIGSVSFLDHPKATHYRDIARIFSKSLNVRVLKERHGSTVVNDYTTDCFNNGKVVYQRKGPYTLCHMNAYLYQYIIATPVLVMQIAILIIGILMLAKQDGKIRAHVRKHGMIYGIKVQIIDVGGEAAFMGKHRAAKENHGQASQKASQQKTVGAMLTEWMGQYVHGNLHSWNYNAVV